MAASFSMSDLIQLDETLWEIPLGARADMRVPARGDQPPRRPGLIERLRLQQPCRF